MPQRPGWSWRRARLRSLLILASLSSYRTSPGSDRLCSSRSLLRVTRRPVVLNTSHLHLTHETRHSTLISTHDRTSIYAHCNITTGFSLLLAKRTRFRYLVHGCTHLRYLVHG